MGGNFWPIFVTVAALSSAVVWKYSPEIGRRLSPSAREAIRNAVGAQPPAAAETEDADVHPASNVTRPGDSAVESPANTVAAVAKKTVPAAPAAAAPTTPPPAKTSGGSASPKAPGPVTPTAQNPTGSPYLEPAAKALREYKRLLADFERKEKGMNIAAQRAAMKKLHEVNARVEFLNRKHREWKASHPAAPGLGR